MIWLEKDTIENYNLPISKYQWVNMVADVFLMRINSVFDCAFILTNEIFEKNLNPKKCNLKNLTKAEVRENVIEALEEIENGQQMLKVERNVRFHRGEERAFSSDNQSFRFAALFESRGRPTKGKDRNNRTINTNRYFREALVQLQKDFNLANRKLEKNLDKLYDLLSEEFDDRFHIKFNDPVNGFGFKQRQGLPA